MRYDCENTTNTKASPMKTYSALLFSFLIALQGCSMKQVTQAVYDSAKGDECMKKTGTIECDLNQ
jgi:hypothetical protein